MTVYLATELLNVIDSQIESDQGATFRGHLQQILPQMKDAYRTEREDFRSHLGASGIGKECGRMIWYSFRWYKKPNFNGRMIRLFNRGHLEEARFLAMLLSVGATVSQADENGKQYSISGSHGHYGGSGDGLAKNVPTIDPNLEIVLEFKTHNTKSFAKLTSEGVLNAKFEHYTQVQQYMRKMSKTLALYLAVNKDTDEVYGEWIPLDPDFADRFIQRADKIIWMKQPPKKIAESAGAFKCRYCDMRPVCHLGEEADHNCRSCAHSYPAVDKQWGCQLHNIGLTKEAQLKGCGNWTRITEDKNVSTGA